MKKKEKKYINKPIKTKKMMNEDFKMAISFVIVLAVVLVLLGLLFFVNGKFVTKDEFQPKTTQSTSAVSYDDTIILVNHIFRATTGTYYVMVFDSSNKGELALYGQLVNYYSGDTDLYTVDLSVKFNKAFNNHKKEEKIKVEKYQDFNFTRPTLLVIENKKVKEAITDKDLITKKLKEKAQN